MMGNHPVNFSEGRKGGDFWLPGPFVDNIQLDIVGFLAILGEGSIETNLQVSTLSKLVFVPRLLPAPQVFFRPNRSSKLEPSPGNVTGVYSGNDKDFVNYIGHVVLDAEDMPDYSVRCVEIVKKNKNKVKAKTKGPLSLLVAIGCAESIGILAVSIYNQDRFAILAVILLSCLSSLAGIANWWYLELPKRRKVRRKPHPGAKAPSNEPPPGDVVVRYPKGSFLVVQCTEDVARELYFAPENVYYLIESPWAYRLMSLAGTLMLMLGIVALGNSQNVQQIIFAAAYMLLNVAYWLVAALPARLHWDLDAFDIRKQRLQNTMSQVDDEIYDDEDPKAKEKAAKERRKLEIEAAETFTDLNPSFTVAMWKAIVATQSIAWVKKNDALPETPVWHEWLQDALRQARKRRVFTEQAEGVPYPVKVFEVPDWDPLDHFYYLLDKHDNGAQSPKLERGEDIGTNPLRLQTGISGAEAEKPSVATEEQDHFAPGDDEFPVSTRRQPTA